jgi:hypothetical protein
MKDENYVENKLDIICFDLLLVEFPCDSQPCQNGGFCFASEGSTYVCECLENFAGQNCQNRIQSGRK